MQAALLLIAMLSAEPPRAIAPGSLDEYLKQATATLAELEQEHSAFLKLAQRRSWLGSSRLSAAENHVAL